MYRGICESGLDDFDMMLTGYAPAAAVVEAVANIATDLKNKAEQKGNPGSFFWGEFINRFQGAILRLGGVTVG